MSRTQAAGKVRRRTVWRCREPGCGGTGRSDGRRRQDTPACAICGGTTQRAREEERITRGAIDWPGVQAELRERGVELRGGDADEAPGAYKEIAEVLAHHRETVARRARSASDRGRDGGAGRARSLPGLTAR